MLLIGVIAFAVLSLTAFWIKPKHIHLFELLAIWFSVTAVNSPSYSFFLVNKQWITVPDNKELAIIRIIYTVLLCPLIITWILDKSLSVKHAVLRCLCYLMTLAILFLAGFALHVLGVIRFSSVGMLWYTPFKAIPLIIALLSVRCIRYLMRKDGIYYESTKY